MTLKLSQLFAFVLLLTLASCGGTAESEHMMDTTSPNGKPGINIAPSELTSTIDPICKMNLANSKIADTAHYNGGIYAFCAASCKEAFKADPEKYVAQ